MTDRRARVTALARLLGAVVGLMVGAFVYGEGHGLVLAVAGTAVAGVCSYGLLWFTAGRTPAPVPDATLDLDRVLPSRREVSARRRGRGRRVLLRADDDDSASSGRDGHVG